MVNRKNQKLDWKSYVLFAAGIYNILWGSFVVLFPSLSFQLTQTPPPRYFELWQCVGMIVAVYGLGYFIAGFSPLKHWPIVLVGFLGKVFGPIGFIGAIYNNVFPLSFGINILFNDLIWWIPFFLILKEAYDIRPSGKMKSFNVSDLEAMHERYRAKFVNSLSGFKSSNLIGTTNKEKQNNLCIVSSVFHLGANPALMGMIIRPDTVDRHTLSNIRETGKCTLNHVNQDILLASHQTSARYPKELSEFKATGLTPEFLESFTAPYVRESFLKVGLSLVREEKLEENGTHFLVMKIEEIHCDENAFEEDGHLNLEKIGTLTVSGLDCYHQTNRLGRLTYAKPETKPRWF